MKKWTLEELTQTEIFAGILILIVAISAFGLVRAANGENKRYSVEIEFTDGSKKVVQFESESRPKIEGSGCLYNYDAKSWICGCRDIKYTEIK